ncbi:hypothetical protein WICMUC_004896 [Wickerhamomyces mucosus]|uniref:Altered inheritance of mitochondria protein 24, mitochondrial n=1 Tax=Wickerhamomyces mucosus TaxID=1378264 RepID=A0A9P8PEE5_9ASCO|nr:hypothetical protein WICMUC_004896 [Wickerhamomyces mucosus]
MNTLRPLSFIRKIHIENTSYVSVTQSNPINTNSSTFSSLSSNREELQDLEKPTFTTLGQPPTLVQIQIPPSYPVYFLKKSLLSVYGTSLEHISLSNRWLDNPLTRILYGFHSFQYQKLETTAPATALINVDKFSTVSSISLDGTVDWAILPRNSIVGYTGTALRITTAQVPKFVKSDSKKWFSLSNNTDLKTGLHSIWKSGYSLTQGRGDVILKGRGLIFKVDLDKEEEILIKRDSILGISVNGDELSRCVSEHEGFNVFESKTSIDNANALESTKAESTQVVDVEETDKFKAQLKRLKVYWYSAKDYFHKAIDYLKQLIPTSSNQYVKITGPRTILLQSDISSSIFDSSFSSKDRPIEVLENKIFKAAIDQNRSEDYLSYVTVKNGQVTFQNTPDFQKTIDSMPKKT